MNDTLKKITSVIGSVAPFVASMIGSPLAGAGVKLLSDLVLGKSDGSPEDILKALSCSDPEVFLKIKKLSLETELKYAELGMDKLKIEMMDRDSARAREASITVATGKRDPIQILLIICMLIMFFSTMIMLWVFPIEQSVKDMIFFVLGCIVAIVKDIYNYYFGSSIGSEAKSKTLDKFLLKNNGD